MDQEIEQHHHTDSAGNPAGGWTAGAGIDIKWQDGPLGGEGKPTGPTGAFVEGVITAAIGRLEFYQASKFPCAENLQALTHLRCAMDAMNRRTDDRVERGVEGTHTV